MDQAETSRSIDDRSGCSRCYPSHCALQSDRPMDERENVRGLAPRCMQCSTSPKQSDLVVYEKNSSVFAKLRRHDESHAFVCSSKVRWDSTCQLPETTVARNTMDVFAYVYVVCFPSFSLPPFIRVSSATLRHASAGETGGMDIGEHHRAEANALAFTLAGTIRDNPPRLHLISA